MVSSAGTAASTPSHPKLKVCLVSTVGGHLSQLEALASATEGYDRYLVTVRSPHSESALKGVRRYFVRQVLRNPANLILNLVQSVRIFLKERPEVVITTGAGDALPTVVVAGALGSTVVFVESLARVRVPSLFGRIAYRWCALVLVQWPELRNSYPRAVVVSPVIRLSASRKPVPENPSVLVLTGTHSRGFERLIRSIDDQAAQGSFPAKVLFQIGSSSFEPSQGSWFRFLPHEELLAHIRDTDVVVTHDGSASIAEALSYGKPTVVVPRRFSESEVSYDSDQLLAKHLALLGLVTLVSNPDEVADAVRRLQGSSSPSVEFPFPNAVRLIRESVLSSRTPLEYSPSHSGKVVEPSNLPRAPARVVVVTPVNPNQPAASGVRTYTEALAAHLASAGSVVTLVTTGRGAGSLANVRTLSVSETRTSSFRFLAQLFLHGSQVRSAGEIIHLQRLDHVLPLLPWLRSRSLIVTLHGDASSSVTLRHGRLLGLALRMGEAFASLFVDGLVAVDEETRRMYQARFPWVRGRIQVIPNGFWFRDGYFGEPGPRSFEEIPAGAKIVLFGGRLSPEKNLGLLFNSFAEVLHRIPSAFLVVVGEGPEEPALRAQARSLGLTRFLFVPTLDQRNLFNLIRQAAVVAVPSYMEGGPFIALEAICLGTPVLATPVGQLRAILSRWEVGIIEPPDQPSFASGLYQILERGKSYYAANCRAAATALSFEATFRETAEVYARVKSSRRR